MKNEVGRGLCSLVLVDRVCAALCVVQVGVCA